jgi:hypothetical protein
VMCGVWLVRVGLRVEFGGIYIFMILAEGVHSAGL